MSHNTQLMDLYKDLLRIPSITNDIPSLFQIIQYVQNYFADLPNASITIHEFNQKPSIIIWNFDGQEADIILSWHLDVVPPTQETQFEPMIKDGIMYARWATDMKDGVAILMHLMKDILINWYTDKKILLMLTTDEEVGGFDGVWALTNIGYTANIVLIPDSGDENHIINKGKGILSFDMEYHGKSCHSAKPRLGDNAIDKIIQAYQLLKSTIENTEEAYNTELHRGTTVNMNIIQWGTAGNVISDYAKAHIDIRFTEDFTVETLQSDIRTMLQPLGITIYNETYGECVYSDPLDPDIERYFELCKNIIWDISFASQHGATDGRWFKNAKVLLHKWNGGNLHTDDERTSIDSMHTIYECYKQFIYS